MKEELTDYRYRGARATVILHQRHLRKFLETWRTVRASGVALPETDAPSYGSWEALLRHVLRWARGSPGGGQMGGYMVWTCEKLDLPDPEIGPTPEEDVVEAEVESYLEHLLERWRLPLVNVEEKRFHRPEYTAPWKVDYCIDAMLEHAVMHPLRHQLQLEEL
ncbi:MAG: hypothetical protein GY856_04100 [bacterium]|nr:hypothetical protein [bacterium]